MANNEHAAQRASLNDTEASLLNFQAQERASLAAQRASLDGSQQHTNAVLNVTISTESRSSPSNSITSTLTSDTTSR